MGIRAFQVRTIPSQCKHSRNSPVPGGGTDVPLHIHVLMCSGSVAQEILKEINATNLKLSGGTGGLRIVAGSFADARLVAGMIGTGFEATLMFSSEQPLLLRSSAMTAVAPRAVTCSMHDGLIGLGFHSRAWLMAFLPSGQGADLLMQG